MQGAISHPQRRRCPAGTDPAKRMQILDGAARVFTREGFEAASVASIAAEAGVSKGTLYVYFEDKLDLFISVIRHMRDRLFGELAAELAGPGSFRVRLSRYGRLLVRTLTSEEVIRAYRVMLGALEKAPELGAHFSEGVEKGQSILSSALRAEMERGVLRISDPDLACNQFFELCQAGLFRYRLLGLIAAPPSDDEITRRVDAAVDMFMHYYGAGRSKERSGSVAGPSSVSSEPA